MKTASFTVHATAEQSIRWKRAADAEGHRSAGTWLAAATDAYLRVRASGNPAWYATSARAFTIVGRALPARFSFATLRNPTTSNATFSIALPSAARVRVEILDLFGRSVAVPLDRTLQAGDHVVPWTSTARPGIYFARVRAEGFGTQTRRFALIP